MVFVLDYRAYFFILSIIGFFIWSDSESLRALFVSFFVIFVGIYLLLKSFDQSKIFITTFPSEISMEKISSRFCRKQKTWMACMFLVNLRTNMPFIQIGPIIKQKNDRCICFFPFLLSKIDNWRYANVQIQTDKKISRQKITFVLIPFLISIIFFHYVINDPEKYVYRGEGPFARPQFYMSLIPVFMLMTFNILYFLFGYFVIIKVNHNNLIYYVIYYVAVIFGSAIVTLFGFALIGQFFWG